MSIDYRLNECTPAPACYQDFQCAIRFVHAHAEKYRVDTKRIFLIGQSAGGQKVSLAATLGDGQYPRTLIMVEALKKAGATHTFHRYPEMGHMGINQEVIDKSLAFIKEISANRPRSELSSLP